MNFRAFPAQSMLPHFGVEASTFFSEAEPAEVGAVPRPCGGRSCGGVVCLMESRACAEQPLEAHRSGSAIRSRESGVNAVMGWDVIASPSLGGWTVDEARCAVERGGEVSCLVRATWREKSRE